MQNWKSVMLVQATEEFYRIQVNTHTHRPCCNSGLASRGSANALGWYDLAVLSLFALAFVLGALCRLRLRILLSIQRVDVLMAFFAYCSNRPVWVWHSAATFMAFVAATLSAGRTVLLSLQLAVTIAAILCALA